MSCGRLPECQTRERGGEALAARCIGGSWPTPSVLALERLVLWIPGWATVSEGETMSTEMELRGAIERVEVGVPIEVVVQVKDRMTNFLRLAKELNAACDQRIIEWIEAGGVYVCGPMQTRVVKQEKSEKPKDKSHVPIVDAAFTAAGGDMSLVAGLIASDGIKPGALKRLIGQEQFDELYETTWKPVLRDGAPAKKLVTTNLDFVNG